MKELKGHSVYQRLKDASMQTFPCFMQNVSRFGEKGGIAPGKGESWLSQVTDNSLHFRLEEGAAFRIVMQGFQLGHEQWTTLYPSVEGLHGGFGTTARLIEQSQFGLAIGTDLKHDFWDFIGYD